MPTLVLLWVWICAYLNCAGWTLVRAASAECRRAMQWRWRWGSEPCFYGEKRLRPICFPVFTGKNIGGVSAARFPLAFLALAAMAFLEACFMRRAITTRWLYRLPRVLHWLAADQWHWIHTTFPRVNTRACGIEWVSAPFIALLPRTGCCFSSTSFPSCFCPDWFQRVHAAWGAASCGVGIGCG